MKNKIYEKHGQKWDNIYYQCDNYILLNILKSETNESYDILIDEDDFEKVKLGQWFVYNKRKDTHLKDIYDILWSKIENGKQINYLLHQYILNTKGVKDIVVDHKNLNRFDNRKQNLRICDNRINQLNQNNKGYYLEKSTGKYLVRVNVNKKEVNIGRYKTEEEAEIMYLKCCIAIGLDKIIYNVKDRIDKLNITLSEEDYNNKYIKKVINLYYK